MRLTMVRCLLRLREGVELGDGRVGKVRNESRDEEERAGRGSGESPGR